MGLIGEDPFQSMGKGGMSDIMQEDGDANRFGFVVADGDAFLAQYLYGLLHQMGRTQCMMKTGMQRSGVNVVREATLFDPA